MDKPYGLQTTLKGLTVDEAVAKVTEALKAEGFGVLTQIDVEATLKQKIGVDLGGYRILGACNPKLAHRALTVDPQIGLLLPCNVVVRRTDDGAEVSIADPRVMFQIVENPSLSPIVDEVTERLERVSRAL